MSLSDFNFDASSESTSTDEGQPSGSDQFTEQSAPEQTQPQPTAPQERTFRQAEVDRIVADRLARERAKYERQQQQAQQPPPQQYGDPMEARLAPVLSQFEDIRLENEISKIGRKYGDFTTNENAILEHALAIGTTNLEHAYRDWKYDQLAVVDKDAIGKQAVEKYLSDKKSQSAAAPRVESKGGATPTTGSTPVNWDNADKIAKDFIAKQTQHRG